MAQPFRAGERVLLVDSKQRRHLVTLAEGGEFHTHAGFVPHAEIIGEVERSRRPAPTLRRCCSISASVVIPVAIRALLICSTVARSSSVQAGPPIGKYPSACTSLSPAFRRSLGSVLP